jgi:hypothetical protein
MRTYDDIDWEEVGVAETDVDGSGTRIVLLEGYAKCCEGGGHFIFEADASSPYPYDDYDDININSEEFVPDEPEHDGLEDR